MSKIPQKPENDTVVFTQTAPVTETENTMLAALLLTLGVNMKCTSGNVLIGSSITSPGGMVTWQFEPSSEDGKYQTAEVMARFSDKEWLTDSKNESPIAYIACAFHNYKRLIDLIKQQIPIAVVKKGHRKALIRVDADPHWQGVVERFLNGSPLT